jgi:hypothetical protein
MWILRKLGGSWAHWSDVHTRGGGSMPPSREGFSATHPHKSPESPQFKARESRWIGSILREFRPLASRKSNISADQAIVISHRVIERDGTFLVFGAGEDSVYWSTVAREGIMILEDDPAWMAKCGTRTIKVAYESKCGVWMPSPSAPQAMPKLPKLSAVLVDGPWGAKHGREQSIYAAAAARRRFKCPVFVHDYERQWERASWPWNPCGVVMVLRDLSKSL